MEHFNDVDYSWFCLFGLSQSLPLLDSFASDCTDLHLTPHHGRHWCNKHWSLKHTNTYTHLHNLCYYTIGSLFFYNW